MGVIQRNEIVLSSLFALSKEGSSNGLFEKYSGVGETPLLVLDKSFTHIELPPPIFVSEEYTVVIGSPLWKNTADIEHFRLNVISLDNLLYAQGG